MAYVTEDKLAYNPIFAGAQQNVVTEEIVIENGQGTLKAGAVIGVATPGGKGTLCDSAEHLKGILIGAVDATSADAVGVVAVTGEFVEDALTFGAADADTLRDKAEEHNIYFRKMVNKEA